jgi:hypothetical protein
MQVRYIVFKRYPDKPGASSTSRIARSSSQMLANSTTGTAAVASPRVTVERDPGQTTRLTI